MGKFARTIFEAFNKTTGEIVKADELFENKKDGFEIRKEFYDGKFELSCSECDQKLNISGSKYDRLHFKHNPFHEYCILSDAKLSPKEHKIFTDILRCKESDRHKELKNKIGKQLAGIKGVDSSSIIIDNRFIIRGKEKRKPDVYCNFRGKELVFEIQLSQLSLGYILNRHNFYKKNGMYLIWILDNFDIHDQGTLERDIKYLTKYENFFKLDEESDQFKLSCEYKYPFLTDDNQFLSKWSTKSVTLEQIKFDEDDYQIYFYNFGDNRKIVEAKQKKNEKEILAAEKRKFKAERKNNARRKVESILKRIKKNKDFGVRNYKEIIEEIQLSSKLEIKSLNERFSINKKYRENIPLMNYWISTNKDDGFINFLLNCKEIKIDVNKTIENSKSLFQETLSNPRLNRDSILKLLFKRGYILTDEDIDFFIQMPTYSEDDLFIYKLCSNISNIWLIDSIFLHQKLIFILESARQKKIIGYRFNNWISFANNAIYHHQEYWEYIEIAFKKYGLWDKLIDADRKGSFQKKVSEFYTIMPKQKYDFDEVFSTLFHDLQNED